jgi:large subunit ribosomal protein L22
MEIMEAIAKTRYLKGSPRKARLVIDLIRGRNVAQALNILKFTDKRAAKPISKCLNSAIANAIYQAEQQNIAIDPDDLWIKKCFVDMGPTKHRRRLRPAPQGRAYREQRHYCHITIQVSSEEVVDKNKKAKFTKPEAKIKKKSQAEEVKKQARGAKKEKEEIISEETKTATAETPKKLEEKAAEKPAGATETKAEEKTEMTQVTEASTTEEAEKNGEKEKA